MISDIYQVLQKFWGFSEFRSPQKEIIKNVLAGNDTIALLPTGGGKSLCYQLPALLFKGKTIVVTPLIALMEDQVKSLEKRGIKAIAIHGNMPYRAIDRQLDNFIFGDVKMLFISPERIQSEVFRERYKRAQVDLIAVDEAHCISQWGYDFRPSYLQISMLKEWNKKPVLLALTATATEAVLEDIKDKLQMEKPTTFRKSYFRDNLGFYVVETSDKRAELLYILRKIKSSVLVYVRNRGETLNVAKWLNLQGISAVSYHGGMEYKLRENYQEIWMNNQAQVIVCTNAFGMGIDKPDVRCVVHLDIPASLEEYFQEAGRAGRDGKLSRVFLLFENADAENAKLKWAEQFPEISMISHIFDLLCRFYKVAYGAGPGESFAFRLVEFAQYAKYNVKHVFQVMQILDREGWIELSDGFVEPTRIQIIIDRQALYEPGLLEGVQDSIVVQLLRKYEGMFTLPVKIDEYSLSKELGIEEESLMEHLKILEGREILSIQWKKNEPQITFLRERPKQNHFFLDHKRYDLLKMNAGKRLQAILNFTENDSQCRQRSILEYFGEHIPDCQQCDVCLVKKIEITVDALRVSIMEYLHEHQARLQSVSIKDLFFKFPIIYRKLIKRALIQLEDEKTIRILPSGLLQVT